MDELASLVRARREELALSYVSLTTASVDSETGARLSHGWIHRLESGKPVNAPRLPQLRALAAGLRLPLTRLQEVAAAEFFGMPVGSAAEAEAASIAERVLTLTPEQRTALLTLLDAFGPGGSS